MYNNTHQIEDAITLFSFFGSTHHSVLEVELCEVLTRFPCEREKK